MDRDTINSMLKEAAKRLNIDVFVLYISDPCWLGQYLMYGSHDVNNKEAVYGLRANYFKDPELLKTKPKEFLFSDVGIDRFRRGYSNGAQSLIGLDVDRYRIFGDFVFRENIVSRGWHLHWSAEEVDAALSVSYRKAKTHWSADEKVALRELFEEITGLLPDIRKDLKDEAATDFSRIVNILTYTWQLPTLAHEKSDPQACVQAIVESAFQAFDINNKDGGATVHLLEHDSATLRLKAYCGDVDPDKTLEHHLGDGVITWVADRGQPVMINDLRNSDFKGIHHPCMRSGQSLSALAVPIINDGRVFGVLNLECKRQGKFKLMSVPFLSHAAAQAALSFRLAEDWQARELSKDKLREVNEFLHSILENIPIMFFIKNAEDLRFTRVNKAAEDMLGVQRRDLLGKSDYDIFPNDQAVSFIEKDREALEKKELVDIPREHITTKTGQKILHTKKIPILDKNGIPQHLLGICEDITERTTVEDAKHFLLHDHGHLMERAVQVLDDINRLNQQGSTIDDQRGDLLRRARTLLLQGKADARTLLNFFIKLPGVELKKDDLQPCNGAVRAWFNNIEWRACETFLKWDCEEYQLGDELFLANRDGVLCSLGNLEINARKSRPSRILLSAKVKTLNELGIDAEYVVLSVADNGSGMPDIIRDRVFRTRSIKQGNGHGLGTQIIRRVIDDHRGLIRFATREDVGTLVELWFPRLIEIYDNATLLKKWKNYKEVRDSIRPVSVIGEEALQTALGNSNCPDL